MVEALFLAGSGCIFVSGYQTRSGWVMAASLLFAVGTIIMAAR